MVAAILVQMRMKRGLLRNLATLAVLVAGFFLYRWVFDAGVAAVEAVNPAGTGYLGGLNVGGDNYKSWGFMAIVAGPVGGRL